MLAVSLYLVAMIFWVWWWSWQFTTKVSKYWLQTERNRVRKQKNMWHGSSLSSPVDLLEKSLLNSAVWLPLAGGAEGGTRAVLPIRGATRTNGWNLDFEGFPKGISVLRGGFCRFYVVQHVSCLFFLIPFKFQCVEKVVVSLVPWGVFFWFS